MLEVKVQDDQILFGEAFALSFQRTLRIPDDDKTYPLPPGLGAFPVCQVADYADRVPAAWREQGGVFIPMYQREALWIRFADWYGPPHAVKVGVGQVNAVSGKPWRVELSPEESDYLVCPPQPWLDGINAGEGFIRQFVAMPLGLGVTVEAQVTGEERFGGIQIEVYAPKPGRIPEPPEQPEAMFSLDQIPAPTAAPGTEMGLAAGGKMRQQLYPDPYGIDTWDPENTGKLYVHIVNSLMYREITGEEPPPTPISAQTYTERGYPWFDLYDEQLGDIAAPEVLQQVQSVGQIEQGKGLAPPEGELSVEIPEDQVVKYKVDPQQGIE